MRNELAQHQQPHIVQQFCEQDARKLVEDMLLMYGKKFTDQWSGLKKGQVIEKLVEKLSDLTYEQFLRGLKRLDTAEWPPSIPEFKKWCLGGYEYQSCDEAWLQALMYEKNNRSHEINKFAKQAFDEVIKPYSYLGSSDTIYKVFCSVYKRIITEAKERNEADDVYEAVLQVVTNDQEPNRVCVANGEAQKHLEELKKKLNVKNRTASKPQKLQPQKQKPVDNYWPDPFDNPDEYRAMTSNGFNRILGGGA
ncbi:hypothetical protein [Acinetobacter sp. CWB-B33]|uniref:hypothetical protein n=1 Tax=Acinetobacter sp. CWB-B33 TaxID=2815724 RepID=UPI0031FE55AC